MDHATNMVTSDIELGYQLRLDTYKYSRRLCNKRRARKQGAMCELKSRV